MDAVLAILVLGAVIFFGALISAGNERQRKALDGIREQVGQWAQQDLRLKREKLAREVRVDDPVAWLNRVIARIYGEDLGLTITEVFDSPQALVCTANDGSKVVLSPTSPNDICRLKQKRSERLSRLANVHPVLNLPYKVLKTEISILNGGILFDLEVPVFWRLITNDNTFVSDKLWMYR